MLMGPADSNFARHAFDTFIPLSVDSESRKQIIFSFFDLLAAVAARGKTNGMGGRKLSRMAGWWAFEHSDDGKGFDGGYRAWTKYAIAPLVSYFTTNCNVEPQMLQAISSSPTSERCHQRLKHSVAFPPFRAPCKHCCHRPSTRRKRRS
jgi:hypothetical protein